MSMSCPMRPSVASTRRFAFFPRIRNPPGDGHGGDDDGDDDDDDDDDDDVGFGDDVEDDDDDDDVDAQPKMV